MSDWVEILNETKREVTDTQDVEFELSTNESHKEYWMSFNIAKHTGENAVNGRIKIYINGAEIGYYMLAHDYAVSIIRYVDIHVYMQPIRVVEFVDGANAIETNNVQVLRNTFINGEETGTGKLVLKFPANYTGSINKIRVLAK